RPRPWGKGVSLLTISFGTCLGIRLAKDVEIRLANAFEIHLTNGFAILPTIRLANFLENGFAVCLKDGNPGLFAQLRTLKSVNKDIIQRDSHEACIIRVGHSGLYKTKST